ncbi:MAG: hypothetical protein U0414_25805 [Polyangiaceae bacterium]
MAVQTVDLSSAAPPVSAAPSPPGPGERVRSGASALDILRDEGTTAWGLIDVARLRSTPIADSLVAVVPFRRSLERAGIAPQRDFDHILLAVHPSLTLVEHHVDDARLEKFLDLAVGESDEPASRATIGGHACAKLRNKNGRGTACALAPGLLLITNNTHLDLWDRLAAADIPSPSSDEAAHFAVLDERIFHYLGFPNSLGAGEMSAIVRPDNSLRIDGRFKSEHPSIDQKTLVEKLPIPGVKVHMQQGEVSLFLEVTPEDADALVAVLKVVGG